MDAASVSTFLTIAIVALLIGLGGCIQVIQDLEKENVTLRGCIDWQNAKIIDYQSEIEEHKLRQRELIERISQLTSEQNQRTYG